MLLLQTTEACCPCLQCADAGLPADTMVLTSACNADHCCLGAPAGCCRRTLTAAVPHCSLLTPCLPALLPCCRLLTEKLEQLEAANAEVDGDADSEEEEDQGMGNVDIDAAPALSMDV